MVHTAWFVNSKLGNLHSVEYLFFAPIPAEVRTMFGQQADYANYMDTFFRDKPNVAISWIHDLGQGRYGSAADALLRGAEVANNLEGKHVCLNSARISFADCFCGKADVEHW